METRNNTDIIVRQIEEYCDRQFVPTLSLDAAGIILEEIGEIRRRRNNSLFRVLEIGTAVGLSAIKMGLKLQSLGLSWHIDTIEKNQDRANIAGENIKKLSLEQNINVINGDILDHGLAESLALNQYELILIDGPKGQYLRLFQMVESALVPGGSVVFDNVLFKGMVLGDIPIKRRKKTIVKRLRELIEYIRQLDQQGVYRSDIYHTTDGVLVATKQKQSS